MRDALHRVVCLERHTPVGAGGVQGAQQLEWIDMTVHWRVAGPDHHRSDLGQSLQQGRTVQDFEWVIAADLVTDRSKALAACLEFGLGKAQEQAARLPELNMDAGFVAKTRCEGRPLPS